MNKLIGIVAAGLVSFGAFAQASQTAPASSEQKKSETKAETPVSTNLTGKSDGHLIPNVEIEIDAAVYSAYVWRGAIVNDRPVAQPCVSADWTFFDPFYLGFYVWENNDLTGRRRAAGYRGEWNEFDYNVHVGTTLWSNDAENDDDAMKLNLEVGHEWYTYNVHGVDEEGVPNRKSNPTTYEWYAKLEFENPIVTPYFQTSWEYQRWNGMYAEAGLKKEITLAKMLQKKDNDLLDQISLSGDFCLSGGSWKYLDGLYTGEPGYGYTDDDDVDHTFKSGVSAATLKGGIAWAPCDNFSLGLVIAYTSTLNENIRDAAKEAGSKRDIVWGGVEAKLTF